MHDVFETLTDEKRRCEYDKAHRIKGKWPRWSCRGTVRLAYRPITQEIRDKWIEVLKNEKKGTPGNEEGDKQESPDLESEPASPPLKVKPLKPKAKKPHKASRPRSENKRPTSPGTQARPAVTVVTVEVEPEAKGAVAAVSSAVAQVGDGVAGLPAWVWGQVCHHTWQVASFVGTAIAAGAYYYGRLTRG